MSGGSQAQVSSFALRVLRRLARPVRELQDEAAHLREQHAVLAAQVEQLVCANERLVAYQDRFAEELTARYEEVAWAATALRSVAAGLGATEHELGSGAELAGALTRMAQEARSQLDDLHGSIGDLRVADRQTQVLLERALDDARTGEPRPAVPASGEPGEMASATGAPARRHFEHPAPGFDLLYRAFEDRNRGSIEAIRAQQEEDYLELIRSTPDGRPVVDLGCGRGEFVHLLTGHGVDAIGVDSNLGQLVGGLGGTYVEQDLFDWMDAQPDASHRAVCALHVVEHLPVDLQVRLAFEARRILAPGGVLVLETPNTQSVSVGGSRFWVDPTHERPVHPAYLSFLLDQAGFTDVETRFLHPVPLCFVGPPGTERLVDDLNGLLLGPGDVAVLGRR